jgi:hypothetical protein
MQLITRPLVRKAGSQAAGVMARPIARVAGGQGARHKHRNQAPNFGKGTSAEQLQEPQGVALKELVEKHARAQKHAAWAAAAATWAAAAAAAQSERAKDLLEEQAAAAAAVAAALKDKAE